MRDCVAAPGRATRRRVRRDPSGIVFGVTWRSIPLLVASLLVACAQAEAPPAAGAKAVPAVDPAPDPDPASSLAPAESSEAPVEVTITYCIP